MTASISSNSKAAAALQPDASISKVSSSKAKEVSRANAPEIINKAPAIKIASTPAAVVSLGNTKSSGLDLYQKNGSVDKSSKTSSTTTSAATQSNAAATRNEKATKKEPVIQAVPDKNISQNPSVNTKQKSVAEAKLETKTEKPLKEAKAESKAASAIAAKSKSAASEPEGFIAGKGDVVVDIQASESGYDNRIYWSTDNFKTKNYIGIDNQTGSVNLGKFKEGTKIEFGIDNGVGQFFKSGAASGNIDNLSHAKVTKTSEGTQFGFEDLVGGGDNDFNDAVINVHDVAVTAEQPEVAAPPINTKATKAKTNTNRSGLGDGTNPGQGGSTINATNEGTNNPGGSKVSKASAYTTKMIVESQLKVAV
jgi:hypothetical protein